MEKKKVLIIDDSPLALELAKDFLEDAGYSVFTASNGIEANKYIFSGNEKPDAIVIDVMMPLLDGNKKTKILRENPLSKNIPIILLSSKQEKELKELVRESGADHYLQKPFTKHDIVNTIEIVLTRSNLRGEQRRAVA